MWFLFHSGLIPIRPRIWSLRKQGEHSAAERVLLGDGQDTVSFYHLLTGSLGFWYWPASTATFTISEEISHCVLYSFPRTPRTKETITWLKQQKFIHLRFGSLRVWEIWESLRNQCFPWRLWRRVLPYLFLASSGCQQSSQLCHSSLYLYYHRVFSCAAVSKFPSFH